MGMAQAKEAEKIVRTGRPRANVDVDKILKLYLEEKLSVRQVAEEMGVSHATVARRIAEEKGQLRSWRMPGEY